MCSRPGWRSLGTRSRLIEQARFPRSRLGKSLSPGVTPLLKAAKLEQALDAQRVNRVHNVWVDWAEGPRLREDPREQGMIVDRGAFDLGLIESARAFGVEVRQPARVLVRRREEGRWRLTIGIDGRTETHDADFLAEAGGRGAASGRPACRTGPPTLAVFAYWRAARLPPTPQIERGEDAWFWGVPLPNGTYNTLAFLDPKAFGAAPGALTPRFLDALARSRLMEDCRDAERVGPARAVDATPYLADDVVGAARSAWATQRWRSIRSRPAASRRPYKARFPAPSSPTPWFGGRKRGNSPWASTGPN